MRVSALVPLAGLAAAVPFSFPLQDGFPSPSPDQLVGIQRKAGGFLPNGALPTKLSAGTIAAFQLISVQETFEVGFFSSLFNNITAGEPGYSPPDAHLVTASIFAIRAQEQLHALGANALLKGAGAAVPGTCKYNFMTTNFDDAIALATTFTDLVLATLDGLVYSLAEAGGQNADIIPLVAAIAEQESEQVGLFRYLARKYASAAPFLTGPSPAQFAWSALQMFLVPSSCPKTIALVSKNIPSFPALTASTAGKADSVLTYTTAATGISSASDSLVYITGQQLPVVVPISNVKTAGGVTTFQASFPYTSKDFSKGLVIAAVAKGKSFADTTAVAAAAVAGPGLIEV